MLYLCRLGLAVLALVGLTGPAFADPISITPSTLPQWTTGTNSNLNADDVEALIACGCQLSEAYKQDVGAGSDSGPFASSYQTLFANTPNDPADATITYLSGAFIDSDRIILLVKDGNHDPAQYAFDISAWNGTDTLALTGFWPGGGAISHVAIYTGSGGGGPQEIATPEPGSLILMGTGLGLFGLWARYKKSRA